MRVLYNEWDEPTAAWLRELINGRHLPSGAVDTRSIGDVRANDLRDFDQCHFFAGIGGWPLALRWAGLEGTPGVWTGSPPCQPFSVAGKGLGQADERHLAPVWLDLIREQEPVLIFGEQVEAAIRVGWLDDLFDALEGCGYACAAAVLPACSVGAPHIRKRLFFGAVRLADAHQDRFTAWREIRSIRPEYDAEHGGAARGLAYSRRSGLEVGECLERLPGEAYGPFKRENAPDGCDATGSMDDAGRADTDHGFWSGADWLGCRDGKFRPVEPGTQPLAHGIPARVGRLRGYGNAIVPQVAAQFITEFLGAIADMQDEGLTP
ncbi:DNA cytosine methyltransferase [Asaia krungthepensis]|uniref:DNA (cytosine-5-)-methyltransferase n=1 Tax=Asaia krungthepensis NRIC 0535 TaxID=1307925 RepID=A0ABQ0Q351_9PROT|nr:DNA cytosine methyltransferase [Asaia krungthepensis]GBQ89048.1 site-specific DNA methylase [Asaia krungthepensis NRIC 0535]